MLPQHLLLTSVNRQWWRKEKKKHNGVSVNCGETLTLRKPLKALAEQR